MPNPWLDIPLQDYEGHMQSLGVGQLAVLSALFGKILERTRPSSVAILGIAGGNGLEHINAGVTTRVAGFDLNAAYLSVVRARFPELSGLDLLCVDLVEPLSSIEPFELVHAALIFEHAGTGPCLDNAVSLVRRGGAFSVVLQLPSEAQNAVAPTDFPSMQSLKSHFALVDPSEFTARILARGFRLEDEARASLPGGKAFWSAVFRL
jgi:hypothetical protein